MMNGQRMCQFGHLRLFLTGENTLRTIRADAIPRPVSDIQITQEDHGLCRRARYRLNLQSLPFG